MGAAGPGSPLCLSSGLTLWGRKMICWVWGPDGGQKQCWEEEGTTGAAACYGFLGGGRTGLDARAFQMPAG